MSKQRDIALFSVRPSCKRPRAQQDASSSSEESETERRVTNEAVSQPSPFNSPVADYSSPKDSAVSSVPSSHGVQRGDISDIATGTAASDPKDHQSLIMELLERRVPPADMKMPRREYQDSKRKSGVYTRSCNRSWFEMFDFLAFSEKRQGLFCLPCVLFPSTAHRGSRGRYLISEPLVNWKDALSDLRTHEKLQYHLDSVAKLAAFKHSMEKPSERIDHAGTV